MEVRGINLGPSSAHIPRIIPPAIVGNFFVRTTRGEPYYSEYVATARMPEASVLSQSGTLGSHVVEGLLE